MKNPFPLSFKLLVVLLAAHTLFARSAFSASTQSTAPTLEVVIRSASGKERMPLAHDGIVDRIGLRPGQVVAIRLKAHGKPSGQPVLVSALDGGELRGADTLSLDGEGNTQFEYKGGSLPGLYRVLLSVGSSEYTFEFYVLDMEHSEKNPRRVRIVD